MPYLGTQPAYTVLETGDIADDAITLAKMAAGTAGNLITYDGSTNPAAVVTGSSTQILTSNGAGAAPTFQAAASGGKVLQVVEGTLTSAFSTTSGSKQASGLDVDITPSSSSNKVLIIATAWVRQTGDNTGTATTIDAELRKGGSAVSDTLRQDGFDNNASVSNDTTWGSLAITHLSSPSTTSSTTYEIYINAGSGTAYIDNGSIIAMEIEG